MSSGHRESWRRVVVVLGVLAVCSAGCKRLGTGARESFGKEFSCPEERITVTERPELRYSAFIEWPPAPSPPAEVVRDPARLAKWKADQEEKHAEDARSLDYMNMFQVTGCDHEVLMGCAHPTDAEGDAVLDRVSCFIPTLGRKK